MQTLEYACQGWVQRVLRWSQRLSCFLDSYWITSYCDKTCRTMCVLNKCQFKFYRPSVRFNIARIVTEDRGFAFSPAGFFGVAEARFEIMCARLWAQVYGVPSRTVVPRV